MQNVIIAILTIAYILAAYVGPVVAFGLSAYWAYEMVQTGGSIGSAFVTFTISALVLLVGLLLAKKLLKVVMNMVDIGDDTEPTPKD